MSPRVYTRKFDWDEAAKLRTDGLSYAKIAEKLGVSEMAVRRVLIPELKVAMYQRTLEWQRQGVCPDCGKQTTRRPGKVSLRCSRCAMLPFVTTVREDTLRCMTCGEWKPDEDFPYGRSKSKNIARRGRHRQCGACQTIARRDHRRRNRDADNAYSREYRRRKRVAA